MVICGEDKGTWVYCPCCDNWFGTVENIEYCDNKEFICESCLLLFVGIDDEDDEVERKTLQEDDLEEENEGRMKRRR